MDTYLSIDFTCILCCDCIDACELDGQNYLTLAIGGCGFDGEPLPPMIQGGCDYTPCHHCDGFRENQTPCQKVCPTNSIKISRW